MSNVQRKPIDPEAGFGVSAGEPPSREQQEKYRQAASLLRRWMEEEEEDAEVWPLVEEELKSIRVRIGG
jgi:hypothetical protein